MHNCKNCYFHNCTRLFSQFFVLTFSRYCCCWRRKEEEGFHTLDVNIKKDVIRDDSRKKIGMHLPIIISQWYTRPPNFQPRSEVRKVALSSFGHSDFPCKLHPVDPLILYGGETTPWRMGFWNNPPPFLLDIYIYNVYIWAAIYNVVYIYIYVYIFISVYL